MASSSYWHSLTLARCLKYLLINLYGQSEQKMSKDYHNEVGYETLISDFKRYNKQTPKGVTLVKEGQNIYLQFKTTNKSRSKYKCACSFTLDGMVEALSKAHMVAEKLKKTSSEAEFWQWYDSTIKESVNLKNDQLTFAEAILVVEEDFWNRPSRTKRKRDRKNPSDISTWNRVYGDFYRLLPLSREINLSEMKKVIDSKQRGTTQYAIATKAMKRMARVVRRQDILKELEAIDTTQTVFRKLQSIDLKEFLDWRDKTLGITASLHRNSDIGARRAWLWVFSAQIVYALRINEVFAIQNLDKPFVTKDGVTIPALSDPNNTDNLIYIGEYTNLGTTVKTGDRIARPNIPPKYPDLIELLEIKAPLVPTNKPKSNKPSTIRCFHCTQARQRLVEWDAPFTQTHADRHLGNINGMQAGISLEVRAMSLGHTARMNDSGYKKRLSSQTRIDLLLHSNVQAIDFVTALNEAKRLVKDGLIDKEGCALLMAKIYQKDSSEIILLL